MHSPGAAAGKESYKMGVGGRPPRVFGLMSIVNTSENRGLGM